MIEQEIDRTKTKEDSRADREKQPPHLSVTGSEGRFSLHSVVEVNLQRLKPQHDSRTRKGKVQPILQMAHVAVRWMESPGLSFSCRLYSRVS